MAVTNFVPDVWSGLILSNLSKRSVALAVTNRDYEGEVRNYGDSVKITSITDPTIGSYTAHNNITIEDVDDATRSLLIDQADYFAFEVDDIERAQSVNGGALVAEATRRAAYGLANELDTQVLSAMGTGASASNPDHQVAEATISTVTDAYDALVNWSVLLDSQDCPDFDRFVVVTPAFHGKLLKDSRFIAAGDPQSASTRSTALVGTAAGFEIYKSNNLPAGPGAGAGTSMIAGSKVATTLAQQISSVETGRMELRFASFVKGLSVWGVKVLRPNCLVSADVIVS